MSASTAHDPLLANRRLLFLSPVTPAFTGNGLAMRAARLIEGLAANGCSVSVAVIPLLEEKNVGVTPEINALCEQVFHIRPPGLTPMMRTGLFLQRLVSFRQVAGGWPMADRMTPIWARAIETRLAHHNHEVLFVFRLSTLSILAEKQIRSRPVWLDLDELDSAAHWRRAALARSESKEEEALRLEASADRYADLEHRLLPRVQGVSVASVVEKARLPAPSDRVASVFPNVIQPRDLLAPQERSDRSRQLLFIGSFGHAPNVDAVTYFCREILPELQKLTNGAVKFTIVGPDPGMMLASLEGTPGVSILGRVENLDSIYEETDLVVIPLRAGGGTRIKILEAFSYGRGVVSTPVGAEGLNVTSGLELILASTALSFAAACTDLLDHAAKRQRLIQNAQAFVAREHSPAALRHAIALSSQIRLAKADL